MSEKYTPVSPETMPIKMELLFPPQPLEIPPGISVEELTARALFIVPDVANASAYEIPEAYIAALAQPGSTDASRLEFTAIATSADLPKDISGLVADIDTVNPWRPATAAELMAFGLVYPALVDSSPLIALGATDATHYPLSLKRTGSRGLEVQTDMSGLKREGKAILLVRNTAVSAGMLPTIEDGLTADSFISIESHAEKITAFNNELAKFSPEEIETLARVSQMTELLGDQGAYLRQLIGDIAFDKIGNVVILARQKNILSADGMNFTQKQVHTLREIMATTAPEADQELALEIMLRPDFLNSATMQLRQRALTSNTVLTILLRDVVENTNIPVADLQTLVTKQTKFSLVIGRFKKLNVVH